LYDNNDVNIDYVGVREELYIESPCNEIIKTRFGKISYLEFLVLENMRLRKEGRFSKLEIMRSGYTCRLLVDKVVLDWER
jgi:hypothetical protein